MFRNRRNRKDPITLKGREQYSALSYLNIVLRSLLFNLLFFTTVPIGFILFSPILLLKTKPYKFANRICRYSLWLLKVTCRLDYRIEGQENLPEGGCVIASKHQSAWDTMIYYCLYTDVSYVLKKELLHIPIFNKLATKLDSIAIDRDQGRAAILDLKRQSTHVAAQNRKIIIFPEGSRTTPGEKTHYHKGVYLLYKYLNDYPLIPVALDSGLYWPRRSWIKWPGTITLKFLKAVPQGLDADQFMKHLSNSIENESEQMITKFNKKRVA